MRRCDSFNTAQIQILSGPDPEGFAIPVSDAQPPDPDVGDRLSPTAARPASRGRAMRGPGSSRRPTSFASVMRTRRFSPYPVQQRTGRSASPFASRTFEISPEPAPHTAPDIEDIRSDTEDDDVDFWGEESPSMLPKITQTEGDDNEEEDEGKDNSLIDGDPLDDDDDDYMEIFGHR